MSECIFCNIIERKLVATFVYEDDKVVAFKDVNPQAPVHVLVMPKAHKASLNEIDDACLYGEVMAVAVKLAKELGIDEAGYRIVANCGAHGGQSVYHVHLHLLGGRHLEWPPG